MRADADRYVKEAQEKLERAVDETVERQVSSMNGRQLERLGAELSAGADATIVRK